MLVIDCTSFNFEVFLDFNGDAPEERAFHRSVIYGSKILYFGGINATNVFNDYFSFNTGSNASLEYLHNQKCYSFPYVKGNIVFIILKAFSKRKSNNFILQAKKSSYIIWRIY